jgi:phage baseplate assembly protein W
MKPRQLGTADKETVKRDLINHIFTARGERLMMPSWGTRIPLMTFEPNDEQSRQIIYDDIKMVIDYDPRVKLVDLQVLALKDNNAVLALADVFYIEFKVQEILKIEVKTQG